MLDAGRFYRAIWNPRAAFRSDDAVALLKLVETYEPVDMAELVARIPQWQQVLRQEINESGAKPFFNERVEELHGGGRDQRRGDNSRVAAKGERASVSRTPGKIAGFADDLSRVLPTHGYSFRHLALRLYELPRRLAISLRRFRAGRAAGYSNSSPFYC